MSWFKKLQDTYDSLWKAVIRPKRNTYPLSQLGHEEFRILGKRYKREAFNLTNSRGLVFFGYHFIPLDKEQYSTVIYLHGNSSNCTQGLEYMKSILVRGLSLVTFDFSGCGNSEGDYISLGWFECEDLAQVIAYIRKPCVKQIALWGRSMGAVTALMYLSKDPTIKAAVFDSPFTDLQKLIKELCTRYSKIPDFLVKAAMKFVAKTIKEKGHFDIYELKPLKNEVPEIFATAGYFVAAEKDELIDPSHTRQIYEAYKGTKKHMEIVAGGHNSDRPRQTVDRILNFLEQQLLSDS